MAYLPLIYDVIDDRSNQRIISTNQNAVMVKCSVTKLTFTVLKLEACIPDLVGLKRPGIKFVHTSLLSRNILKEALIKYFIFLCGIQVRDTGVTVLANGLDIQCLSEALYQQTRWCVFIKFGLRNCNL